MRIPYLITLLICLGTSGCTMSQKKASFDPVDLRKLPPHWFITDEKYKYYDGLKRAKLFADHVAIYSIAANKTYDDDPLVVEDIPFPRNEQWTEITSINGREDELGFAAKAWKREFNNGKKELVIAYRGTDDFRRDFFRGNLVFAKHIFGRTQFDAALEYAENIVNSHSGQKFDEIIVVGHSLGGGLAEYIQRLLPGIRSITFDTSPNQGRLYSLFSGKYPKDSIRVYEKGEVLSYFRYALSPDLSFNHTPGEEGVRAIWMDFYNSGPLKGHSMRDLSASLLKVASLTGNKSAIDVIEQLTEKRVGNPALYAQQY